MCVDVIVDITKKQWTVTFNETTFNSSRYCVAEQFLQQ